MADVALLKIGPPATNWRIEKVTTSDTVPTVNLGTGTADATTFLRGDQVWATPPGGGGFILSVSDTVSILLTVSGGGDLSANFASFLISQFTNDAAYITGAQVPANETDPVFTAWLAGPPNVSEFTNDVPYLVAADLAGYVQDTRQVIAGTGLSGGGDLSADRTFDIANTGVAAAAYGSATSVATFTVNAQGQLTAASNTPITFPTGFITSIIDTNSINLTVGAGALSADLITQSTATVVLSVDALGLKADFASMNISQFTNDSGYLTSLAGAVTSVSGTASRITSTGGSTPVIDIAAAYDALWQPVDADLSAIAALGFVSTSFLKKTAANTWALDTNTYLSNTPAALSKTDDTNVTLTLGGTPLTSLLQAVSLTLGWTGTLSVARGGTAAATAADARTNLGVVHTLQYFSATINPAGNTTYYIGAFPDNAPITTANRMYLTIPYDCVLIGATGSVRVSGTVDTAANNIAIAAYINNGATVVSLFNLQANAVITSTTVTGLSTTINAGDTIEMRAVTPAGGFTTPPVGVRFSFALYFK